MSELTVIAYELLLLETGWLVGLSVRMVIYQPQFFPRLHYLARILDADIYGIADNVQFVRKHAYHTQAGNCAGPSYQAHTPIRTRQGTLVLDYSTENGFRPINETRIVYTARSDKGKSLRLIEEHYRKAPYFRTIAPLLHDFFARDYTTVADINCASTYFALGVILETGNSKEEIARSLTSSPFRLRMIEKLSESGVPTSDKQCQRSANDWLVDSCKHFGANEYYYGGTGAGAYMDFDTFARAGVALKEQNWRCKEYPQLHGGFVPNLSVIDLLMNVSPAHAREVLLTENQ